MWRKHWQAPVAETEREGKKREQQMCFGGGLNHLYGGSPSGLPLVNHLALSDLESTFSLTQGPTLCTCTSFIQDGFQGKGFWEIDRMYYSLVSPTPASLTPKEPFCTYVVLEVSLRMRNMWSLYLLSKQDTAPPCSCHNLYLEVSVHRGQLSVAQSGTHLSSASYTTEKKVHNSLLLEYYINFLLLYNKLPLMQWFKTTYIFKN